jgi:uncharacterized protein (DUF58 family)
MRPPLFEAPESAFLIPLVQIFLIFCLFFALLFDVGELTLFSLILLALGLGANLWSRASLSRLTCSINLDRTRLFCGQRLEIGIKATNAKILPVLLRLNLFTPGAISGPEEGQWIHEEMGLLWYQHALLSKAFFPNQRGVYNLGPPTVRGGDLFGFFFREKETKERFEVVVYPRRIHIRQMNFSKREFFGVPGSKSPVEDPIYVFGTRDYQPGRPSRSIHWKASARHNRLQEKLCEPAEQEKVLILLDVDQFENESAMEAFEKVLEVIAALILQLDRRGIATGFATNGMLSGGGSKIIPISRSPRHMVSILETLARVGSEKTGSLTRLLSMGYQMTWGVSTIYFACCRNKETLFAGTFMKHRHIPARFVLAKKSSPKETADIFQGENDIFLESILAPENCK